MKAKPSLLPPPDNFLRPVAAFLTLLRGIRRMLPRKPFRLLACALACLAASSCKDLPHDGTHGLFVTVDRSACPDAAIDSVMVCIHDDEGRPVAERRFGGADRYSPLLYVVPDGCYTVSVAANWPADDPPRGGMSRPALMQWLTRGAEGGPRGKLSGRTTACVADGGVADVTVRLSGEAPAMPALRLKAVLPPASLMPYGQATRAQGQPTGRRLVAEAVSAATGETVARLDTVAAAWPDGGLTVSLPLDEGTYDILLWSDCGPSADGQPPMYDATDLNRVTLAEGYAGGPADMKDAATAVLTDVGVTAGGTDAAAYLERPVAKYVIVADDAADYLRLSGSAPIGELTATVECEGFFPSAFNVAGDRPCDSSTGYAYSCRLSADGVEDGQLPLAADWVMVNGDESYVTLTVTITDGDGRLVARRRGVTVPYRRGCVTTVSGHFLTAGGGSGGIGLDHDWEDNTFVVEF